MKIVIVEDEFYAVKRLESLINQLVENPRIIEKIDSVEDAVTFFGNNTEFDLVFLDIQLSDGNSFQIFDQTDIKTPIIFTTAYDEYALDAFKVNSIDYLLKPINKKDLKKSLNKMNRLTKDKQASSIQNLMDMIAGKEKNYKERFLVKIGEIMKPVSISNIAYFFTENQLVYLVTKNKNEYRIEFTLTKISKKLNPKYFFRINRQMIVAYDYIKEIQPYFNNRLILELSPEFSEDVVVSKRKSSEFLEWIK